MCMTENRLLVSDATFEQFYIYVQAWCKKGLNKTLHFQIF